jgi:hypothetical protein
MKSAEAGSIDTFLCAGNPEISFEGTGLSE